ncbi:DUF7577 domain-containing protein [Natronoglomus mannanivorans]|uniref:DUF7577 domain-containing protein n=1 Tax=Natronoglomus mannanivorans TaxID=2979990 RepID=A0AAP3E2F5_9EURY|nr:hypothetical protein [Halobacteria archaeon AArc-xg1-1]
MNWLVLFFLGAVLLVVVTAYALGDRSSGRSAEPVLPSHYDPQNYLPDESKIPGWCRHCETMNDADYRFCENCSAKLPDVSAGDTDLRRYWFSKGE